MNDFKSTNEYPQESYQTGSTQPPKSYGGIIAILLILVIFLSGIVTILSMMNVHLFRMVKSQDSRDISLLARCNPAQEEVLAAQYGDQQATLGITTQEITSFYQHYYDMPQGVCVSQVEPGSDSCAKGLQPGDILTHAEGQSVAGMTSTAVRNIVWGKEGSFVELTVLRDTEELTFSVERRKLQTTVAEGVLMENGVGLVRIYNFDDRCADESIAAIETLMEQGAEKIVFDVRNNGGGYAHEMVALLDYLLPEGDLFRTVDYAGRENVDTSDKACLKIPMAVLVNTESYSAAEFFAAALRDYDAAVIVGEQTSGKGYFQNTFKLNDGSAVALSTGKYFTPKGISLEGVGITPDVMLELGEEQAVQLYLKQLPPEEDAQLQAAIAALAG